MTNPDREELVRLADLRSANVARQKEWDAGNQLTLAYRGNELAGEVGEACNVIKKLERERLGIAGSRDTVAHLAEELADVVICADLIAMHEGIDLLGEAVPAKFNATSEKVGLNTRYEPTLRRLASSDGGVKGEPEPVAWSKVCNPPTVGGTYIVGGYIDDGTLPRHFERDFALFRQTDDGPEWSLSGKRNIPIEYWHDIPAHPEHRDAIVTAQPADAGMREAFVRVLVSLAAAISILERTPKAKKAVASDKMFDTMLNDYRKALEAGRQALTAPGATTKYDGGGESGPATSRPEVSEGEQRLDGANEASNARRRIAGVAPSPSDQWLWRVFGGGFPPGHEDRTNSWGEFSIISNDDAVRLAADDPDGVYEFVPYRPRKPSDPSSTRSEVTASLQGEDAVERVARLIEPRPFEDDYHPGSIGAFNAQGRKERAYETARAILATGLVPDEAAIRAATSDMLLAGARSIGNTTGAPNFAQRAQACWDAMWKAKDGVVEPKPAAIRSGDAQ